MNLNIVSTHCPRHTSRPVSERRRLFAVAASAAILAVGFAACTKGDMRPSQQVLLEAAASAGQSPWMDSVATANMPTQVTRVDTAGPAGATETQDDTRAVSGDQVGLYGGTPGISSCNTEKMVTFLESHPQQATAWKHVTGANDVRSYAKTLTPVVLTHDTRVTNHGFKNGAASPFQSVLETGTPVLIDDRGVPRVRCACGNPLAEPQSAIKPDYTGTAWKTFKKTSLVTVQQSVKTLDKVDLVSVQAQGAPPPPTPFAAIVPGESTPMPAPETKLPEGTKLESVAGPDPALSATDQQPVGVPGTQLAPNQLPDGQKPPQLPVTGIPQLPPLPSMSLPPLLPGLTQLPSVIPGLPSLFPSPQQAPPSEGQLPTTEQQQLPNFLPSLPTLSLPNLIPGLPTPAPQGQQPQAKETEVQQAPQQEPEVPEGTQQEPEATEATPQEPETSVVQQPQLQLPTLLPQLTSIFSPPS
jgi:uncharacterized protein DUF6777